MDIGKKTYRLRLISMLTILCMIVGLSPATAFADNDGAASAGETTALQEGEMRLNKVAEPVEGEVNSWKVTVTVESKDAQRPKDYILVFDRSGSMLYDQNNTKNKTEVANSRIVYAREAAKQLVEGIYDADDRNRVAVLSFASASSSTVDSATGYFPDGTEHTSLDIGLSKEADKDAVCDAIDAIKEERVTGGTYTQLALHEAQDLMAAAHQEADGEERDRVIILLTDGVPTVATEVDWNQLSDDQFERADIGSKDCQTYRQSKNSSGMLMYIDADTGKSTTSPTSASGKANAPKMVVNYADAVNDALTNGTDIPKDAFDYDNAKTNTIGYGANTTYATSDNKYGDESVYGNIMNLTIAEANNIRAEGDVQGIFVVGYDVTDDEASSIEAIAGDDNHYVNAKGEDGIKAAMEEILKKTSATVFSGFLSDQIPVGFAEPEDIQVSCGTCSFKDGVINWEFDTPDKVKENQDPNEAIERYATLSYVLRVEDSNTFVEDKFFKTNGDTKITYDNPLYPADPEKQKTTSVDSPQVKVSKYTITKKVINGDSGDTEFTMHVTSPSGTVKTIKLKNNESQTITNFHETGNYKVEEILDSAGYSVKYLIDGVESDTFSMETQATDASKLVNIEIQNTPKDYKVSYRFESLDPDETLPDEVMALLPSAQDGIANGTKVTAENPNELEVTVGSDTWVFKGYDAKDKTIEGADIEFVGTWTKVHNPPYKAVYEYVSGTPGKELPDEVKNLTPEDVLNKDTGDVVEAEQPAQTEVAVEGGKWVFESYDKDSVTFTNTDEKFTGTWTFVEDKTYKVTYEYVSGTPGKELPDEVKNLTPEDVSGLKDGETQDAEQPAQTEVVVEGGKWVFESYDKDSVTIDGEDGQFTGTWTFVADSSTETGEDPDPGESGDDPETGTTTSGDDPETVTSTSTSKGTTSTTVSSTKYPETGDASNVTVWILLLLVACGGIVGICYARKKSAHSHETDE